MKEMEEEGVCNPFEFRLVGLCDTCRKFGDAVPVEPSSEDVSRDLYEVYQLTTDKRAFVVGFSASLHAPFVALVRFRRYFFPNLLFLGIPETGKNPLLNLLGAKIWNLEENIKVTGDYHKDFTTMANLEGRGMPPIVNDLDRRG